VEDRALAALMGSFTYLGSELVWAVPVLILQWAVGRTPLWNRRRALMIAVLLPTIYLAAADSVAIANGIWFFHAARITNLRLDNVPVEEILFFLLTNSMVVQSIILVGDRLARRQRAAQSSVPLQRN